MVSRQGRGHTSSVNEAQHAVVKLWLAKDVVQLGYLVAPNLVATCWSLELLPLTQSENFPSLSIGNNSGSPPSYPYVEAKGENYAAVRAWANSRADCAVLRLERSVLEVPRLTLGTVWGVADLDVGYWVIPEDKTGIPVHQEGRVHLRQPQEQGSSGLPLLSLRPNTPSKSLSARGSPILSARSGRCFGHALGFPIGGNVDAGCPANLVSQLMPFCIPYRNGMQSAKLMAWRRQFLSRMGNVIEVAVLCSSQKDYEELKLVVDLHAQQSGDLPGIEIRQIDGSNRLDTVPERCILLLVLDKDIAQMRAFQDLDLLVHKQPERLWASILADRFDIKTSWRVQQSGFQLSAGRPLRWFFDRGARLAAWSNVLDQLRIQLSHCSAGIRQPKSRLLPRRGPH